MMETAQFFLIFANRYLIIPLILIGLVTINRRLFYEASCLALFSLLVNVALKVTFQVPLTLIAGHPGYALPSGHMQLATVFYGWLACHAYKQSGTNRIALILLTLVVLTGIGWALTYKGYHSLSDVIAGAVCALILIRTWQPLRLSATWLLPLLATVALVYSAIRYTHLPRHAWMAYGLLMTFVVGERLSKKACQAYL